MESLTTELLALLIATTIYLVRTWLASKNASLDKKAGQVQNIILEAISLIKSEQTEEAQPETLMGKAVNLIQKELGTRPELVVTMNKLGIDYNSPAVTGYIETALHAAKLGLQDVLKEKFKNMKK